MYDPIMHDYDSVMDKNGWVIHEGTSDSTKVWLTNNPEFRDGYTVYDSRVRTAVTVDEYLK